MSLWVSLPLRLAPFLPHPSIPPSILISLSLSLSLSPPLFLRPLHWPLRYRRQQRKLFAQSWVMVPSDLTFFAKRLRAVAPKGRVGADKMKGVYKQCFPNRADEMEAFAAQVPGISTHSRLL